jgi:internalin A
MCLRWDKKQNSHFPLLLTFGRIVSNQLRLKHKNLERMATEKPLAIVILEQELGFVYDKRADDTFVHEDNGSVFLNDNNEPTNIQIWQSEKPVEFKFFTQFSQLINLTIFRCKLNVVGDFDNLINLRRLAIYYCEISNVDFVTKFPKLEALDIVETEIQNNKIAPAFYNLKYLNLEHTALDALDFLKENEALESLNLSGHKIDPQQIANKPNLNYLNLSDCKLTDISFLTRLKKLEKLLIEHNLIRKIPHYIFKHFNYDFTIASYDYFRGIGLLIHDNPLEFPPNSVLAIGPTALKDYFESVDNFGEAPLSEGRIIFVGDGSSGKSSIIEKTLYGTFDKGRPQTNGIKIEHFSLLHDEDQRELNFHVWDFGGQEIQHAVHKFFFTEGCLYVLVLDNRKEEEPEYWLQQIESIGGSSPVMVVFNKQDQNNAEIADRKLLKEKYPNIVGFYNTSCATGLGMDEFKNTMYSQAKKLRTVNEVFPKNWLAIKKSIEEKTSGSQHYLTYEVYREICNENQLVLEDAQKLLLKYFNTIGAITWFGEDANLQLLQVMNPAWITQGVYKILTSQKTSRLYGQIEVADFKEMLQPLSVHDFTYDEKHYPYLLGMMMKFELCYTPDRIHLFIPSAFGKTPKWNTVNTRGRIFARIFCSSKTICRLLSFIDSLPKISKRHLTIIIGTPV